jgi:RimJ/RimL family protein N-acetyltransferase
MSAVVFRCDGDDRIGAGHVSRSLRIAQAFAGAGAEVLFAGRYEGVAASLLEEAGLPAVAPAADRPCGVPGGARAAIVDSYELPAAELEALAGELALAMISDGGPAPRGATVLAYHLGSHADVAGPAYAPVDPRFAAARRPRGFERALVSVGGGRADPELVRRVEKAAAALGIEVLSGREPGGLVERARAADVAVTAAGFTPYELACAGVPTAIVVAADNQLAVARAFTAAGLALAFEQLERLSDPGVRDSLAAAGPATIDGYGSFRARDALAACFAGRPPPAVRGYRPARADDAELLLAWRNSPEVRAASHNQDVVARGEHEAWLAAVLADGYRSLFIVEEAAEPVGTVRFDRGAEAATISVTIAPERRGRGVGSAAVREASELLLAMHSSLREVVAEVTPGNERSLSAFERAGFLSAGEGRDGSSRLALDRPALRSGPRSG